MNAQLKQADEVPSILDEALRWAAEGFDVFPLIPKGRKLKSGKLSEGKEPAVKFKKEATSDADTLRTWFGPGGKYASGYGLALRTGTTRKNPDTGADEWLVVVDIDMAGHGKDGLASLKAACSDASISLDDFSTRVQKTPGGGWHALYWSPVQLKARADVLGPQSGVDIRADTGAYIAVAPTAIDGKRYAWEDASAPIASMGKLADLFPKGSTEPKAADRTPLPGIDPKRAEKRVIEYLQTAERSIKGAGGDQCAYRVAAKCLSLGATPAQALDLMLSEHWDDGCGWAPDRLAAKVEHARRYMRDPQGADAPEAAFDPVIEEDPIEGARGWDRARIESNIDKIRLLRKRKPEAFGQLRQAWEALGELDAHELDALLADATFRTVGVDNVQAAAAPGVLDRPDVQRLLGELKAGDNELLGWIKKGLAGHGIQAQQVNAQAAKGKQALDAERLAAARAKDGRVRITYRPGAIADSVDEIERALLADEANERVFRHGGEYVAVRTAAPVTVRELKGGGEYPPMAILHRYDAHSMAERISRCVRLETMAGADAQPKAIPPTEGAVRMLLSRRGGAAPIITGIVEAPTVRSDGSLIAGEGYDPTTGLFATFGGQTFDVCVDPPTQQDAATALQFLARELFAEFPFAEPVDQTAAVAALITGMMRPVLEGDAPGFVLASPTQGTGKTALAQAICHGAFGRPAAAQSWPGSDEEMSKFLLGALREGQRAVVFDNLRDGTLIDNAELAAAMTSPTYSRRGLGGHDTITVPTAVLWLITGNNVRPAGDMPSRLIEVYLDAGTDRPDRRDFKRDLVAWVAAHRPAIVRAVVTVVRAYLTAGAPKGDGGSSRFPRWDRMVRFPLIFAGGPDVGIKFDKAYASDPGLEAWSEVLQRWRELFGSEAVTARELLERINTDTQGFDAKYEGLRQALQDSMGRQRHDKMTAVSVGKHLGRYERRPVGRLRLVSALNRDKVNAYAVKEGDTS